MMEAMDGQTIWKGTASHSLYFGTYVLCSMFCWLVVPIFIALSRSLRVRFRRYEIGSDRILVTTGWLNRRTEELELYRVRDLTLEEPFFQRLFGAGTLILHTTDASTPVLVLAGIPGAAALRDPIRKGVEASRARHGIRGVEMA